MNKTRAWVLLAVVIVLLFGANLLFAGGETVAGILVGCLAIPGYLCVRIWDARQREASRRS
jgi:hypothetical protein